MTQFLFKENYKILHGCFCSEVTVLEGQYPRFLPRFHALAVKIPMKCFIKHEK